VNPHSLFARFAFNQSAVSALEFALILPIMITLYLGGVELGDSLTIHRKVTHVTSALADLVTQAKVISDTDMKNILDASAAIVAPYNTSLLKIKVTGVKIDAQGKGTVAWSDARNDTPLSLNTPIAIPTAVATPNTFLVTAEVHYNYTPVIGYIMTGTFDMNDKFFLRPRLVNTVCRPPTLPSPC
jgi:Flp pilus assembly protein TadG